MSASCCEKKLLAGSHHRMRGDHRDSDRKAQGGAIQLPAPGSCAMPGLGSADAGSSTLPEWRAREAPNRREFGRSGMRRSVFGNRRDVHFPLTYEKGIQREVRLALRIRSGECSTWQNESAKATGSGFCA